MGTACFLNSQTQKVKTGTRDTGNMRHAAGDSDHTHYQSHAFIHASALHPIKHLISMFSQPGMMLSTEGSWTNKIPFLCPRENEICFHNSQRLQVFLSSLKQLGEYQLASILAPSEPQTSLTLCCGLGSTESGQHWKEKWSRKKEIWYPSDSSFFPLLEPQFPHL